MSLIKIGLIREGKNPPDKRVPFTPAQAEEIEQRFPHAKVICQQSEVRCFNDSEYETHNITTQPGVDDCDILMGIKEVPVEMLVPNKTYLFFSHTIKKQPYNRKLLQAILQKNIRLIDYEALKDTQGNRLVAFGRFAGIVGAYNGLWAYGKRFKQYELRRAKLPPIKIILTGAGRVGKGAMETLDTAGIRKVSPTDFLTKTYSEPVYSQLSSAEYHERKEGGHFNRDEFHRNPEYYQSTFDKFLPVTDILMAGAFWNPKAPVLFTRENMLAPNFKIKIIADITCDINGSVPSTIKASSIPNPLYDYNAKTNSDFPAFSDEKFVTVMAVDNLPCELPRSASDEFGRDLIDRILKPLLFDDPEGIIKRGTITDNGKLTEEFSYLQDYVNQPT